MSSSQRKQMKNGMEVDMNSHHLWVSHCEEQKKNKKMKMKKKIKL